MRWIALALLAAFAACGGNSPETSNSGSGGFGERLRAGADCAELFGIRNQQDPKSPLIERMNVELREVGCFMSTSTRTD